MESEKLSKLGKSQDEIMIVAAIPAFNEEQTITKVVLLCKTFVDKVIVYDDGSGDMTSELAKIAGAEVITGERNYGKGEAIRRLFARCRELDPDVVVTIDADMQHDPREIPELVNPIVANVAEIIIGSRFLKDSKQIPQYRRIGNQLLNNISNAGMEKITDTQSGFRAYSKRAIQILFPSESGMGVDSELLIKAAKAELRMVEIPISVRYDIPNPSKVNSVNQTLDVFVSILKHYSIQRPLLFYSLPGAIFFGIGLIFGSWTVAVRAETGTLITNMAIVSMAFLLGGLITFFTGIILFVLISLIRERL